MTDEIQHAVHGTRFIRVARRKFRKVIVGMRFWQSQPPRVESVESRFPPGTRTGEGADSVRVFVEAARRSHIEPLPDRPPRARKGDRVAGMDIHVEYQAGLGGEPEPGVVWFGARRLVVLAIVDRWYGTRRRWWKLQTEDGLYVLRREDGSGEWELAAVARS